MPVISRPTYAKPFPFSVINCQSLSLFYKANEWTGSYMIETSVMKELNGFQIDSLVRSSRFLVRIKSFQTNSMSAPLSAGLTLILLN